MRTFSLKVIAAGLALLTGAAHAHGADDDGLFKADGLTYELVTVDGDSHFTLVGIDRGVKDVVIPEKLTNEDGTYPVTGIHLDEKCDIESITIPSTIETINALISLTASMTTWPDHLKYVRIFDLKAWINVDFVCIADNSDGYVPRGLSNPLAKAAEMYIGDTPVTDLVIPEGTETISKEAFCGASFLKSVSFPSSLKGIGYAAFEGCTNVGYIDIPDLAAWCGVDVKPFNRLISVHHSWDMDEYIPIFNNTAKLRIDGQEISHLTIPESVDSIGAGLFNNCASIKTLYIPEHVTGLGASSFAYCNALENVYVFSAEPPTACSVIGSEEVEDFGGTVVLYHYGNAFGEGRLLNRATLYVPVGSLEAYKSDKYWGCFKNIKEFDATGIGNVAGESLTGCIRCEGGVISFEGLVEGIVPEVYSIDGVLRHRGADSCTLPSGIYIIRAGNESVKVRI